jgi:MoxR-like ATPase
LLKLARCKAALTGRDYVLPDDVKAVAVPALAHRLVLRPELWVQRVSAEDVVREVLETVPTPPAEDVSPPTRS